MFVILALLNAKGEIISSTPLRIDANLHLYVQTLLSREPLGSVKITPHCPTV